MNDTEPKYVIVGGRELEPPNLIIADYKPFPGIVYQDDRGNVLAEIDAASLADLPREFMRSAAQEKAFQEIENFFNTPDDVEDTGNDTWLTELRQGATRRLEELWAEPPITSEADYHQSMIADD